MDEKFLLEQIRKALTVDRTALLFEQLTVSGTAQHLPNIPPTATYAVVTIESSVTTGIIARYIENDDLAAPTTTVGLPKAHFDSWDIAGAENIRTAQIILAQASTTVLNVQYYK